MGNDINDTWANQISLHSTEKQLLENDPVLLWGEKE